MLQSYFCVLVSQIKYEIQVLPNSNSKIQIKVKAYYTSSTRCVYLVVLMGSIHPSINCN